MKYAGIGAEGAKAFDGGVEAIQLLLRLVAEFSVG
jgi:hypothetical protein